MPLAPNRLYHHLAQPEEAGLIEVSEYREVGGGKVERIYGPVTAEPPGEGASAAERAQFLSAMLEATRAEIVAASQAEEAVEHRYVALIRSPIRVSEQRLAGLRAQIGEFAREAHEQPDPDGVWTTVSWTAVARQGQTRSGSGALGFRCAWVQVRLGRACQGRACQGRACQGRACQGRACQGRACQVQKERSRTWRTRTTDSGPEVAVADC